MARLQLNSFNARGLGNSRKRQTIFQWLKKQHQGITLLQETHSTELSEATWVKEWGNNIEFCHGTYNSRGVAILFPDHYDYTINEVIRDNTGRFLLLDMTINEQPIILVNIYAPTKNHENEQMAFLNFISERLEEYIDKNIILGGDFNVCLNQDLDKTGGKQNTYSNYANALVDFKDQFDLIDIWRVTNPDEKRHAWRGNTKKGFISSRLDYWFTSVHMIYDLESTEISPSIKSDHSIIKISFKLSDADQRGRGFWKFNYSLLKDPTYIEQVKRCIEQCKIKYKDLSNKSLVWDVTKCEIRSETISYATFKAKQQRKRIEELQTELKHLESQLDYGEDLQDQYAQAKQELELIHESLAKGSMIRSRATLIEENEKCSKYFLNLEKHNNKVKNIKSIITDDKLVCNTKDIMHESKLFYQSLYKKAINANTDFEKAGSDMFKVEHKKLDETEKVMCDSPITKAECLASIKELPNNKSPGSDGFGIEFYKFFWRDVQDMLYESYTYAFENNMLSLDQRRAILTLIPKQDKDLRYLKHWRPISLLNTDYKILAKVFANRLQKVISNIISNDQVGYVKGRYIGENIRTMLDILEITTQNDLTGLLVLIDFEKAFDTVAWTFLHRTLEFFNFGEYFRKWVDILYTSPLCCVSNNGHSSEFFEISRGIRQGCPISALLFILIAEVLAINVRQQKDIIGLPIGHETITITQLADDTCLYLKDTESLEHALKLFKLFELCAGLKVNTEKNTNFMAR